MNFTLAACMSEHFFHSAVQCPEPQEGVNSTLSVEGLLFNQTISYSCSHGYSINPVEGEITPASATVTCTADGSWSQAAVNCSSE